MYSIVLGRKLSTLSFCFLLFTFYFLLHLFPFFIISEYKYENISIASCFSVWRKLQSNIFFIDIQAAWSLCNCAFGCIVYSNLDILGAEEIKISLYFMSKKSCPSFVIVSKQERFDKTSRAYSKVPLVRFIFYLTFNKS